MMKAERESRRLPDGNWEILVLPPAWTQVKPNRIVLSDEQHDRYLKWTTGRISCIQHALPDLSRSQREVLLTGISIAQWNRIFKDEV